MRQVTEYSLVELYDMIANVKTQEELNYIATLITQRIYIPFNGQTSYEDMLLSLGYKPIEKTKEPVKER